MKKSNSKTRSSTKSAPGKASRSGKAKAKAASRAGGAGANSMWGGRFAAGPAAIMTEINASIGFDQRLYAQDIRASRAHAAMLVRQRIISQADGRKIDAGLSRILKEIEAGNFRIDPALEDIHMHVETRLRELIGPAAGRLHTARSRNDQVATDFRLWVRDCIDRLDGGVTMLMQALVGQARLHAATVMPGFTHLQPAQPVTFGHHMLAYVEMFGRDRGRLADARLRLNENPLGSAALAGTSFPIDRHLTSWLLDFDRPMANSLDGVSDRDFALEFLSAASILAVHLSRLAEEIVIWTTPAFGFITLSDAFTTGSSIMPQKRNPDAAELVRAKAGRIIGALNGLLIVMKGLPLAYGKDMQEDKEPVFDAADSIELAVAAMAGMVLDLKPNEARLAAVAGDGFSTATDLADWLVQNLGLPFRDAHHVTGRIVKAAEDAGLPLEKLPLATMQKAERRITRDIYAVLGAPKSVASRKSFGGTAAANVRREAARWLKLLKSDRGARR